MDYEEFRHEVGNLTVPNSTLREELIQGNNSVHAVFVLGTLNDDGEFRSTITSENMERFCAILKTLDARNAKREVDYFVGAIVKGDRVDIGIHTTDKFFSDEDFIEMRRI